MVFTRKPPTTIDRAVADLERQIAELDQKLQQTETPAQPNGKWKQWFEPPPRHITPTTRRPIPDVPVEPLKELEQTPLPFAQQPDLFNRPTTKPTKPRGPLRHAQRLNRHRFYLCLGLGIFVLVLLWLVVR